MINSWITKPVGILTMIVLGLAACTTKTELVWHEEAGYRWADLAVSGSGSPGFEGVPASKTGVDFVNHLQEEQLIANRHYVNGSGVAVGDVDGDGWPDLYLARLDGPNVLYRNLGGWQFEDVTDSAGVAAPDRFSTGAALADLDGDGDLDLLVTAMGGPNAAFMNDGSGHFTEVTKEAGLASSQGSTTMALADVDGDGDLDLYVGNYKKHTVRDLYPPHIRSFEKTVVQEGETYTIIPEFQEHYVVRVQKNRLMRFEYAEPDRFYLNDGTGRFTPVSFTDGTFLDEDGQPLQEEPHDWALTARFQDANGDGAPDLFVCNDFESPDHFWLGDGTGRFRAAPRLALRKTSQSAMAVAFSDVNRDGTMDFFLADMLSRDYHRYQTQQPGMQPPILSSIGDIDNRPQELQNTLFLNRGDGTYAEVAHVAGVAASEWTWGSVFLDVDLDGYEDLLLATGHAYDAMDADTRVRVANTPITAEWKKELLMFPDLDLKNIAFRNRGDPTSLTRAPDRSPAQAPRLTEGKGNQVRGRLSPGQALTFEEVPDGWGLGVEPDVSLGLALADFDRDGDLDAVINRLNRTAALFRNQGSAPRLAVRLRGQASNTQGIGAKIRVSGGEMPVQQKEIIAGGQYLSSSQALATFAAGAGDSLQIEVSWRSGRRSMIQGVRGNRLYEVFEDGAHAVAVAPALASSGPYFEEVTLGHQHHEPAFDDFGWQPLLPWRLSQQGPATVWADLDGDGDDDLLLGSGRGGRLARFRNDGDGRLVEQPGLGSAAPGDQTGIVALSRGARGALVFVGVSNYEQAPGDSSWIDVYAVGPRGLAQPVDRLAFGASSVGPLALGDLDGDGDVDLFAGGRHIPGRYPEPASSVIYRNEAGRFQRDDAMSAAFSDVGLVAGAALGDLDHDGDQDVVLATEWGPVLVFENQGAGRFEDRTAAYGLDGYRGWWQGVALGDFDEDGRLDIAATNWGWNSKYRRPEQHEQALRLYHGDFDLDGTLDVLEAHYEQTLEGYAPTRRLAVLSVALPYVRRRMRTFQQYAASTLEEVIGPPLVGTPYLEATTLGSMVFLNREDHFEARALPWEAQVTAGFGVSVGDFDGDGHDDLFVSQNLFAVPQGTPRLDAGRGLWLRGDGQGGFVAVAGQEAGIQVYGEQRSAALSDYDGDGRVDLVVSQNGAATKVYRNVKVRAGLRVRLEGPAGNEAGVGSVVRLLYGDGSMGPVHVVSAGSGYWGQSSSVVVLGKKEGKEVTGVWVRWPGGEETEAAVLAGASEVTIAPAR